jgi:hypothetical protein
VRSLLVSVATLTILLVCFAVYQYAQDDPPPTQQRVTRLPETPSRPLTLRDEGIDPGAPAIDRGDGPRIGAGERIKITVYGRDSDRARFEISVDDLTPVTGSINEFLLTAPEIRMRTKDGHAVRVTAQRGVLEADRKRGGALDPRRGKLVGSVVIQYDLLSERERAELPTAQRDRIDPSDLMSITMDQVEFDLEYSKLIVPGKLHVLTSGLEFRATDLEARFNDAQNRVEYLHVSRGGEMTLRNRGSGLGLGLPGGDSRGKSELALMEWMRSWVEAKARAQKAQIRHTEATPASETITQTKDGVPVFHADGRKPQNTSAPVRYRVRFEDDVDARQIAGEATQAHLVADVLEVLHDLSEKTRPETALIGGESAAPSAADQTDGDRFELSWSGRLVVSACAADDEFCFGAGARPVMASGMPVRLVSAGNDVECRRMTYDPDTLDVSTYGTESDPAKVSLEGQGVVSGVTIHSKRHGNDVSMNVVGPGRLARGRSDPPSNSGDGNRPRSAVAEFLGNLEVQGRTMTRPRLGRAGIISLSRSRVIERAVFDGRVTMTQDDTTVAADDMTVGFNAASGWFAAGPYVNQVVGHGNVEMTQQEDSVTCRDIDVLLELDAQGNPVPVMATAAGDVVVARDDGTIIRAEDTLIVDFEIGSVPPDAIEVTDTKALESRDVLPIVAQAAVETPGSKTRIRRLRGEGDVSVNDPARKFELSAGSFDCALTGGREIDTATVEGQGDRPAVVRLDSFTVSGNRIILDVPGQSADVPGAGRLTFRSMRDLDGRRSQEPIPIVVTWAQRMTYRGIENRSLFTGDVHAASAADTTFDCDVLLVEFADVEAPTAFNRSRSALGTVKNMVRSLVPGGQDADQDPLVRRISKEPVYVLATGDAVALTSEVDPTTGVVRSRVRLAGPKLSVNLKPDASKMVIEGPGNLLLEDNRPADPTSPDTTKTRETKGLFAVGGDGGPSNTLIEWKELMWYDFGVSQTRFEGDVQLKHFSGIELLKMRPDLSVGAADVPSGRATFLRSDALTVDFHAEKDRAATSGERRMSGLSADRLQQFQATGSVSLQDESEGLSLSADRVVYWKDREVLGIYGQPRRKAQVAIQRPGELPHQLSVERLFYNLDTGTWELSKPKLTAR